VAVRVPQVKFTPWPSSKASYEMPQAYAHYHERGILKSESFAERCWHLSLRCTGNGEGDAAASIVTKFPSPRLPHQTSAPTSPSLARLLHAQFTGNFG
jgi:hypothetical protein